MMQLPLFAPASSWTPPRLGDLPTSWGSGRVGIDTETRDEQLSELGPGAQRPGNYIVGVSLALEGGGSWYLPVRHAGGGNLPAEQVFAYLRDCARRFEGMVVGANLPYDLDFLLNEGVEFPHAAFRDVLMTDPLINELHDAYSLEAVAARWGLPGKDEALLDEALAQHGFTGKRRKRGIWALHSKYVGPYGEQDGALPLAILRRQEREVEAQDLGNVTRLEHEVMPVLLRMRRRGVRVSDERLSRVEDWARQEQRLAIAEANRHCPPGFTLDVADVTKTDRLARLLTTLGVQLPRTATGKLSVTKHVIEGLHHPIGQHLRRAKAMATLLSTFCGGTRAHMVGERIHCTFNQVRRQRDDGDDTEGAGFGRLSSAHPNLQNQPARDPEVGPMWRGIYLPEEGADWASLDYSQQEPRQAVHFACEAGATLIGDAAWQSALEAARRYQSDPTMDFHQMMADMAGIERKPAKNIFLGLSYGMGGPKLCRDLGLPTAWRMEWRRPENRRWAWVDLASREEAYARADRGRAMGYIVRVREVAGPEGQALMDQFDQRVPFVRRMASHCQDVAGRLGYIRTLSGRRCRFPKKDNGEFDWLHKAFNRLIQGSSADQTKEALVALDRMGVFLQLQVHDEVDFSTPSRAYAHEAAEVMTNVVQLRVPMRVDVEVGPSWGEAA